jgi:putative hydrolase of the HAD superfamily
MTRYRAVLFDAFGTLIRLDRPSERLIRAVHDRFGRKVSPGDARAAVRAEIELYAAHCGSARDERTVSELRLQCAALLAARLGLELSAGQSLALLDDAIVLRPYPDAARALDGVRRAGLATAVVSNGDWSLGETLRGAALTVDAVVDSATARAAKPDPAIFLRALDVLGVGASEALHVGDSDETDGAGAAAAGIDVVILDRSPAPRPGTIGSLDDLAGRLL